MKRSVLKTFVRSVLSEGAKTAQDAVSNNLAMYARVEGKYYNLVLYDMREVGDIIKFKLSRLDDMLASPKAVNLTSGIRGFIKAAPASSMNHGPCHGAYEIISASAMGGYGPLLYDTMMMIVPGNKLTSDRNTVSGEAEGVWTFYNKNRGDVEKSQFDDIHNPKTPDPDDDCLLHKDREALNYAYSLQGNAPGELTDLHALFKEKIVAVADEMNHPEYNEKMFESGLIAAGLSFFSMMA